MTHDLGSDRDSAAVSVTVDLVIFTVRDGQLQVLLVERGKAPYLGQLALPGATYEARRPWTTPRCVSSKRKPASTEHVCILSSCGPTVTPNVTHAGG
jgi:hypothetical protein